MSLSIALTMADASTITYAGLSVTSGRQAIDFDPGAAHQQQFRFKSPGVDGQFLVRAGQTGRTLSMVVRYMGDTKDLAEADYQADAAKLVAQQAQIVCNGQTFKGCNVVPESIRRGRPIKPVGRAVAGQVYFDVVMQFTQDNPAGV